MERGQEGGWQCKMPLSNLPENYVAVTNLHGPVTERHRSGMVEGVGQWEMITAHLHFRPEHAVHTNTYTYTHTHLRT